MTEQNRKPSHIVVLDEETRQQAEEYWTEERMQNATPIELPRLSDQQLEDLQTEPKKQQPEAAKSKTVLESSDPETEITPGVPEKANVKTRPYWNGGKFFFKTPDGDKSCSASFTGSNRMLLSAAHCVVSSTGTDYTHMLFRRAYKNGGGQKISIAAFGYGKGYLANPNSAQYDYSFLYTTTQSGAGWLGLKLFCPYLTWTSLGYPSNYGNSKVMYQDIGTIGSIVNGVVQMKQNPMTYGASGGPWIGDLTTDHVGGNYAIGVNAQTDENNNIYGPLFDEDVKDLYKQVCGWGSQIST